jgi:gamma-butyrobetaine dioxygenase
VNERALVDSVADHLLDLVASMAEHSYGERVDMLQHSVQTAACARAAGAGDELVLAGLLHDVGHVLGEAGAWGLPDHAEVGARYLERWLPAAVVEPIRLHVAAKRCLVATDPSYLGQLSAASIESLREQGGAFDADQVAAFVARPHATAALALRRFDDDGKATGLDVQPLEHYRGVLADAIREQIGGRSGADPISASWARDACRCDACRHPGNGQHLIDVTDLAGWRVESVDRRPDLLVVVLVRDADGARHRCLIPVGGTTPAVPTTRWHSSHGGYVTARLADARSEESVAAFVRDLAEYGIAIIGGLATEPGTVLDFVARVGFARVTNYGALFDVRPDPHPTNLAFTAVGLPLHTDNPYRDPVPTVQFLHCLRASAGGGASLFSDGFNAAEILRAEHPDDFAVLTTTPVDFRFEDGTVDLRATTPLIQLDSERRVVRVTVNHRSMEPVDASRDPDRFYAAYARLAAILADPANTIELTLRPGELVGFDNRRVLHGRRGYDADPDRHLQGCYLDIDAIRSMAQRAADAALVGAGA